MHIYAFINLIFTCRLTSKVVLHLY